MRLAIAIPEEHVDADVLNAGLEATTRLNQRMLRRGEVPTFREANAAGEVKWKPEPPGDERFDNARTVMQRHWGDCDDLAPWHAASLRESGEDEGAEAVVYQSGPKRWHAVVQRSDGRIQDPSKAAGMGGATGVVVGVGPAVLPQMFPARASVVGGLPEHRPAVALRVNGNMWEARADTPWGDTGYGLASLNRAPVASQAIVGALLGAIATAQAAEHTHPHNIDVLAGLCGILDGHDPDEVRECVGHEAYQRALEVAATLGSVAGFSFGSVFHAIAPFASKLISFVPGVGPLASTALDVASKLIPSGGGSVSVSVPPIPGVPMSIQRGAADAVRSLVAPASRILPPVPGPRPESPGVPPGEQLPAQYAALEAYPGGPIVLRF